MINKTQYSLKIEGKNFKLTTAEISVENLNTFREGFHKFVIEFDGILKNNRLTHYHDHLWQGYYNQLIFQNLYFLRGNIITLK